jgi:hypothetical protein
VTWWLSSTRHSVPPASAPFRSRPAEMGLEQIIKLASPFMHLCCQLLVVLRSISDPEGRRLHPKLRFHRLSLVSFSMPLHGMAS